MEIINYLVKVSFWKKYYFETKSIFFENINIKNFINDLDNFINEVIILNQ